MAASDNILGSNLRRLRSAQGRSQAWVAEKAGLSRVGYRDIETGKAEPKAETLANLAAALGVGVGDLVRPGRQLKAVRFRANKRMKSREQLLAAVGRWIDDYVFLEELLGDQPAFGFREAAKEFRTRRRSKNRPIHAAAGAREAIDLDPDEVVRDICGLLEDHGVKVFTPEVASEDFFGLSLGAQDGGPAVIVNTWDRITVERWIFSAAHELGHLLLHHDAYDVERTEEDPEEEKEANLFASHFLMPEHVFLKELEEARGLPLLDCVFKLKGIFRVSWKTVVYRIAERAQDHGRVWKRFYGDYRRRYGRSLKGTDEPRALAREDFATSPEPAVRPGDEPEHLAASVFRHDRLSRLVRRAIEEEKITLSRGAEILGYSTQQMRALTRSWLE